MPRDEPDLEPTASTERHAARIKAGAEGFDALYQRLAPAVHAWAALRIRGPLRSALEPEDVVQDVWWRAMDSFASFDPAKGAFRAWIFRIATHTLLNHFRRLRVRGEMGGPGERARASELPEHLLDHATTISTRAARSEELRILLDEAARLDELDRQLFVHCALEGKKTPAAAELTGMTPAAAAKRWQRLRLRLRERLAAAGIHELP